MPFVPGHDRTLPQIRAVTSLLQTGSLFPSSSGCYERGHVVMALARRPCCKAPSSTQAAAVACQERSTPKRAGFRGGQCCQCLAKKPRRQWFCELRDQEPWQERHQRYRQRLSINKRSPASLTSTAETTDGEEDLNRAGCDKEGLTLVQRTEMLRGVSQTRLPDIVHIICSS